MLWEPTPPRTPETWRGRRASYSWPGARRQPPWPAGTATRGHEFHYSSVDPVSGEPAHAWSLRARGTERVEGFVLGGVHASYLHTHWAATPEVARRLVGVLEAVA